MLLYPAVTVLTVMPQIISRQTIEQTEIWCSLVWCRSLRDVRIYEMSGDNTFRIPLCRFAAVYSEDG